MLRRGETAELRWRNVQSAAVGRGGLLAIRRAKNDPDGRGAVNPISPLAMARLDAIRPQPPEPDALIFGLSEDAIRARIKKVAERIGLGREGYSGHSLRVGHALDLRARGASELDIKDAGRWRSTAMVNVYTRSMAAQRSAVAAHLAEFEAPPEDGAG